MELTNRQSRTAFLRRIDGAEESSAHPVTKFAMSTGFRSMWEEHFATAGPTEIGIMIFMDSKINREPAFVISSY